MIAAVRRQVAEAVRFAVGEVIGEEIELPMVEDPPRPELGDLAVPVALQLARRLGRNPRELAELLLQHLERETVPGVARWSVEGPGFLNVVLDHAFLLGLLLAPRTLVRRSANEDCKVIVEHTSINPNKAAHIGHLRNACLGDSLARTLAYQGHSVEVHNYIDDTGVQVADVVIGFLELEGLDAEGVRALPEPFDYTCWDLYTRISRRLVEDKSLQERRRAVLLALERSSGREAEVAAVVVERIVHRHLRTMRRLGINYDLLVKEGDVVRRDLWLEAFEKLQCTPAIYFAEKGKHNGCWMMRLQDVEGFEALEEADKVLVRSNGAATYVAKDIAYHLWKLGLLDRGLCYEPIPERGGHEVWQTTAQGGQSKPFGGGRTAFTVIDVRQSYLQSIVAQAVAILGAAEDETKRRLNHFAYEMVALSPSTAEALGIQVNESQSSKAFIEMSGRRGLGVKADDLLDELQRRATVEVAARNPDLGPDEQVEIGRLIAIGAARYFLLRFARNTVIVFDLDTALSFEGETGPYLQYAAVRARSIFEKLGSTWAISSAELLACIQRGFDDGDAKGTLVGRIGEHLQPLSPIDLRARLADDEHTEIAALILALSRNDEVVDLAVESLEISGIARYAFALAQQFNRFYHRYPILQAPDRRERWLRLLVAYAFHRRLSSLAGLLGIPLPQRM